MGSKKVSLAALLTFIAIAIIVLYHNISPYITPSELLNMNNAYNVQVVGKMSDLRVRDNVTFFKLTDGKAEIEVIYRGKVQQYDSEVVVVGDWDNGTLYAEKILRKCHTEYTGG